MRERQRNLLGNLSRNVSRTCVVSYVLLVFLITHTCITRAQVFGSIAWFYISRGLSFTEDCRVPEWLNFARGYLGTKERTWRGISVGPRSLYFRSNDAAYSRNSENVGPRPRFLHLYRAECKTNHRAKEF